MNDLDDSGDNLVEPPYTSKLFQPGNDLLGYILFLTSLILWSEGKNLRSVNVLLIIIAIFWLAVHLLAKTKLFTKKELDLTKPKKVETPVPDYRGFSCCNGSFNNCCLEFFR